MQIIGIKTLEEVNEIRAEYWKNCKTKMWKQCLVLSAFWVIPILTIILFAFFSVGIDSAIDTIKEYWLSFLALGVAITFGIGCFIRNEIEYYTDNLPPICQYHDLIIDKKIVKSELRFEDWTNKYRLDVVLEDNTGNVSVGSIGNLTKKIDKNIEETTVNLDDGTVLENR